MTIRQFLRTGKKGSAFGHMAPLCMDFMYRR
jgi:hypothetical protein